VSVSHKPAPSDRSFGLWVGGAFLVIGGLSLWRGRVWIAEFTGGLGAVLLLAGLLAPRFLRIPARLWWKFSMALGWINTRVLLGTLFFLILTPIGIWWRIRGKDPMSRHLKNWPGWSARPARYRDPQHYTKRF
jgi:hypothetical protein